MPKISIIVPVYNVEAYLRICVDSILAQTFSDFECILIDDGSPDNCPSICDEYAAKDGRFKVIHQKNAGTAYARDAGVKVSTGESLVFVDSDDKIPQDALQSLYEKQCETDADIVCGAIKFIYKKTERVFVSFPNSFDSPLEYILSPSVCCGLPGKIYKRKIYHNNLHLQKLNFGEDLIVNLQLFLLARQEKIVFISTIVYIYDNRANGITKRINTFKHLSWQDYPPISCHLWIQDWLITNRLFEGRLKGIFLSRLLTHGILPYICSKRKIDKNEIAIFYSDFFIPCTIKKEIPYLKRVIVPLYKVSSILGFFYILIFNFIQYFRSKVLLG